MAQIEYMKSQGYSTEQIEKVLNQKGRWRNKKDNEQSGAFPKTQQESEGEKQQYQQDGQGMKRQRTQAVTKSSLKLRPAPLPFFRR